MWWPYPAFVVMIALLWCSSPAVLETSVASMFDIKKEVRRYEGKLLLLSAPSRFDFVHFDAQGQPTRESTGEPWTMAGLVRATKIDVHEHQILIDGERVVLVLDGQGAGKTQTKAVPVGRGIHITIELPSSVHDVTTLQRFLASVFTTEGLQERIAEAWHADVDLNRLQDIAYVHEGGRIGTLENGRAVYSWESGVVTKPKAFYKPGPTYAAGALSKRISGVIQVRVIVNEKGFPEILEVIQHLPGGLDAGVLSAVSQWRFQPGIREGVPAATVVIVEIKFHLPEANKGRPLKR